MSDSLSGSRVSLSPPPPTAERDTAYPRGGQAGLSLAPAFSTALGGVSGVQTALGVRDAVMKLTEVIVYVAVYAKVKDQLSGFKDITFLDVEGKNSSAPQ